MTNLYPSSCPAYQNAPQFWCGRAHCSYCGPRLINRYYQGARICVEENPTDWMFLVITLRQGICSREESFPWCKALFQDSISRLRSLTPVSRYFGAIDVHVSGYAHAQGLIQVPGQSRNSYIGKFLSEEGNKIIRGRVPWERSVVGIYCEEARSPKRGIIYNTFREGRPFQQAQDFPEGFRSLFASRFPRSCGSQEIPDYYDREAFLEFRLATESLREVWESDS